MKKKELKELYRDDPLTLAMFGLKLDDHADDEEEMDLDDEIDTAMEFLNDGDEDVVQCLDWDADLALLSKEGY